MNSRMEEKRKNLVRKKESAEVLTIEQCAVTAKREVSKSHQADIQLECCMSPSISEVSDPSTELHIIMISDSEVEDVQPVSERTARHDSKEMCPTVPPESSSKMSRNGNQDFCNGKLQFVQKIMRQIEDLPLDHIDFHTTALRCQGLLLIQDLSQVDSSLWNKEKLLSICIASIFALPSVDTLHRQDGEKADVQALYDQTVKAMEAMLSHLLSENPNTTELFLLLEHFSPWMKSAQVHERARAVKTYVFLLKFAATYPKFDMSPESPRLGVLLGQLCLRLNDPKKEIGRKAMQGIYFLYWLVHQKTDSEMKADSLEQGQFEICKEILGSYDSAMSHHNIIEIIKAAGAFCKLLSLPKCSEVALYIYPRLLMVLLVQLHYNIRHNITGSVMSQDKDDSVSCVVMALKTLLLAVRCYCEFAVMEKEQGWDLLSSCEDHHRGVGLLARAMLQSTYYLDLQRILYLLVPFLERGDEEHQITATAFFVELLCMSEARRLPDKYSICRLKRGLMHEISVIRALSIKGLINMVDWPGKEVKLLLPAMTKSLSGMDGKLFVESVAEIEALLNGPEGADCICNITDSLQDLFSDKSKYTLEESFHFLGWKAPKQIVSWNAWHEHEDVLDETCRYLIQKQEGALQRFLYQGIFYTGSPIISIKRASIMFLSFLVLRMDNTVAKEDLDLVSQTLESLMHDSDVSVCMTAAHAHNRISAILSKQLNGFHGNNMAAASDSGAEKQISNSRSQNSFRNSSSSLFRVMSLWKSANRN